MGGALHGCLMETVESLAVDSAGVLRSRPAYLYSFITPPMPEKVFSCVGGD